MVQSVRHVEMELIAKRVGVLEGIVADGQLCVGSSGLPSFCAMENWKYEVYGR
jgi:hypothetical protein